MPEGVLAVLAVWLVCWILSSDARVARLARILNARGGEIASPEPDAPAISSPRLSLAPETAEALAAPLHLDLAHHRLGAGAGQR